MTNREQTVVTQIEDAELVSQEELGETLKVSRNTLRNWRDSGLPHVKLGRRVFYRISDVIAWGDRRGATSRA